MERTKKLMNTGWRFYLGEPPLIPRRNDIMDQTYRQTRAENAIGAARRDYDDADWRIVTIPHDYIDEIPPSPKENGPHGSRPLVNAWYRRTFKIDEAAKDDKVTLLFDGVSIQCDVYVNSILLYHNTTAGTSFEVDITDVARFGDNVNVVSVYCECKDKYEGWYYEGGGIYRNVWLCTRNRLSVDLWGTYVKTVETDGKWTTQIETTLRNDYFENCAAVIEHHFFDDEDKEVATVQGDLSVPCQSTAVLTLAADIQDPLLWNLDTPHLYRVVTNVLADGVCLDSYETHYGYRTIDFDPDRGLFLNGEHVQLRGFANHQTYAGVGLAMSRSMNEFRIKRMKDMGANSFRCAHSPHPVELYEACDKLGMLVMDENRIFHSSSIVLSEVDSLLKRDRNHPCIFMWSLYNEEDSINRELGQKMFKTLAARVKQFDDTRPVSGATLFGLTAENSLIDHDAIGINYNISWYDWVHEHYPDKAIYGSECAQGFTPTGIDAWREMDIRPWYLGGFMWTAWPQHNGASWPQQYSSARTPIDNVGGENTSYHMYKAYWSDEPYCRLSPAWDFDASMEGKEVSVTAFTNGDEVELFLNGKSVERKAVDPYEMATFTLPYAAGRAKLVAYRNGEIYAEDISEGSTDAASVILRCENVSPLLADGSDVAIVTATLVDKNGVVKTNAQGAWIDFACEAGGEIIASISPAGEDVSVWSGQTKVQCHNGRAQVLVRSLEGKGDLTIEAVCGELPKASLSIPRTEGTLVRVADEPCHYIYRWQLCPTAFDHRPDMERIIAEDQTSAWLLEDVGLGAPSMLMHIFPKNGMTNFAKGDKEGYLIYCAKTAVPPIDRKGKHLTLHFDGIDGKADVYVRAGKKAIHAKKDFYVITEFDVGELDVDCDVFADGEEIKIWVLVDADKGNGAISWPVRWTLC